MNAPVPRSLIFLVLIGSAAVLLLGAFSHLSDSEKLNMAPVPATNAVEEDAGGPELPSGLSPGLAEIIRMAQNHVGDMALIEFIHSSGQKYAPTAEEILYLADLGISQSVIAALFPKTAPTNSTPAELAQKGPEAETEDAPTPIIPIVDNGSFYQALAPYGTWTQVPDYGLAWQPTAEMINPDWRPYVDQGQWAYTDNGYYWQSGYTWGWAAFHYGRWTRDTQFGWLWLPDKTWGPGWVSWKTALGYVGWAPLPPGVGLATAGLLLRGQHIAADYELGLAAGSYAFVAEAALLHPNPVGETVRAADRDSLLVRSVTVNNYSIKDKMVVNLGPGQLHGQPWIGESKTAVAPVMAEARASASFNPELAVSDTASSTLVPASLREFASPAPITAVAPPRLAPAVKPKGHHSFSTASGPERSWREFTRGDPAFPRKEGFEESVGRNDAKEPGRMNFSGNASGVHSAK